MDSAAQRSFKNGEVYASRDEESGRYRVLKIIYAKDDLVMTRLYVNRFDERPTGIPEGLRLELTSEELERGETSSGWGAAQVDAAGLAGEELFLIGEEPVTQEELDDAVDVRHERWMDESRRVRAVLARLTAAFKGRRV